MFEKALRMDIPTEDRDTIMQYITKANTDTQRPLFLKSY